MGRKYTEQTAVEQLPGIGKSRAAKLNKLGIFTVEDLIYYFPRAYENRADIRLLGDYDTENSRGYILTVSSAVNNAKLKNKMTLSKFRAFDDSGSAEILFFNSSYIKDVFRIGDTFRFYGRTSFNKSGRLCMINPKYEPFTEGVPLESFIPVYSLADGISSKLLDKLIKSVLDDVLPFIDDVLPENIRLKLQLPTISYAIKNAHFPLDNAALLKARRRLAFDEMFYFGLGISLSAISKEKNEGVRFSPCSIKPLIDSLPYDLTGAQKRAVNDIYKDTVIGNDDGSCRAMARILVGDVGCGKTVCAAIAIYIAAKSAYQSALMVPTEILANQHYEDLSDLLGKLGISVMLLTSSVSAAKKREIYSAVADGRCNVVIGTHALLNDKLVFSNLGLIVTDEQHRFGVNQRGVLKSKVEKAHMLVMSATPIPRSLALAMYGDLDISRIDELPKGRMRVDTYVVNESYRTRLNRFIEKQILLGGQCYIVCPSIEAQEDDEIDIPTGISFANSSSDNLPLKNAVEYCEQLKKVFPKFNIQCLHGRMKNDEKDEIMSSFAKGTVQILVSTTVIEVGVNVPNATLMIIENAERFGLSQLHQLRGRVGRGKKKSYCVLVSDVKTEKAQSRLEVMRNTYDGYEIAEKDLMLRGPGDFFSGLSDNNLRQSGGFDFKFASLSDDMELFNAAFSEAKSIALLDPHLDQDEHLLLKKEISKKVTKISDIS